MTNPNYRAPGISGTVSSVQQTAVASQGARIQAILGVSATGPDMPVLYTNIAAALAAYGSPGAPGTLPWGLLAAMAGSGNAGGPGSPIIVGRCGTTRATLALMDGAGTPAIVATLQAKGAYAGTAGNGTSSAGLAGTILAGTINGTFKVVTTKGTAGAVLATYDNLTSGLDLYNRAQGDPTIDVLVGPSAVIAVPHAVAAFSGGLDGLSTVPSGTSDAISAMMNLMFSGLVPAPRYICPLWDASAVYTEVLANLASYAGQTTPLLAMAFLGSAGTGTIAANTTLAGTIANQNAVLWGLPGALAYDSALGGQRAFDGFYQAATLMAMKAAAPVHSSLIRKVMPLWSGLAPQSFNGIMRAPQIGDVIGLGAAGAAFGINAGGGPNPGVVIWDHLTTAQATAGDAYKNHPGMLDSLYHAQTKAYVAGNSEVGETAPVNTDLSNTIANKIHAALKAEEGNSIAKVNNVSVSPDPSTVGRYLPQVNITLRQGIRNIDFGFSVGF